MKKTKKDGFQKGNHLLIYTIYLFLWGMIQDSSCTSKFPIYDGFETFSELENYRLENLKG
ncbi:MAG TPA: hypothetical protein DDW53_17575 [Lachnoclostridium sp.]|nr:hypothetical protein [Lachnoclostridium sp.]